MNGLDAILIVLVLSNFYVLGASRMNAVIGTVGIQGILLGLLPSILAHEPSLEVTILSSLAILIKGIAFPYLLFRAMREAQIRREVEPLAGYVTTLLLGALGTGVAIGLARSLPLVDEFSNSLLVPTAIATVLSGFVLLTTRTKAINQVVGYLVLENGVFLFGTTLVNVLPFVVELGTLLDLFVGVFIMGIILNHIQRTFSSLDTTRMTALRD